MKSLSKILLLTLILGLLIGTVFAIGAFAEETTGEGTTTEGSGENTDAEAGDTTTNEEEQDPLWTPYGTLDVTYESVEEHPFVVFMKNEDGAYEFLGSSTKLIDDSTSAHNLCKSTTNDYFIYLRCNISETHSSWNAAHVNAHVTIDLGGHVFSYDSTMSLQSKGGSKKPIYTFKNGVLEAAANQPLLKPTSSTSTPNDFVFNFVDITFRIKEGVTDHPTDWISQAQTPSANSVTANEDAGKYYGEFACTYNIQNCTFDVRNLSKNIELFRLGDTGVTDDKDGDGTKSVRYLITETANLQNITILGTSNYVRWATVRGNKANKVTFLADEDGNVNVTNTRFETNIGSEQKPQYEMSKAPQYLSIQLDNQYYSLTKKLSEATLEDGTKSATFTLEPVSLETPFGTLDTKYANIDSFPFILFNASTGEVLWAGDRWGGEKSGGSVNDDGSVKTNPTEGGVLQKMQTYYAGRSLYVYLRTDHTDAPDENGATNTYYNFGTVSGTHIIDLGGHTLNTASPVFFEVCKNKNGAVTTSNYTIKNGTINLDNRTLIQLGDNNYDTGGNKSSFYVFENINFTNIGRQYLVKEGSGGYDLTLDVLFRNCIFNIVRVYDYSFYNGVKYDTSFTVEGGAFHYESPVNNSGAVSNRHLAFLNPSLNTEDEPDRVTIQFTEGTDGLPYITTAKAFKNMTSGIEYTTSQGTRYFLLDEQNDTQSIYRLGRKHPEYGYIPPHYEDAEAHPILIFDLASGAVETSKLRWGGVEGWDGATGSVDTDPENALMYLASNGSKTKSYALYLQKDITTTNYNNTGSIEGSHIVDLNGHTLTLGANLYRMQAKDTGTCAFDTKNGTVKVGRRMLVEIGALSSGKSVGKIMDITFSNVTIENLITSGENVGRLVADTLGGSDTITANVNFVDCTVNAESSYTGELFALGMHAHAPSYTVNVTFQGGSINYAGDTVATALLLNNSMTNANKVVKFLADEDGNYTTVTAKEGVDVSKVYYPVSRSIVRMLSRTSVADGIATYAMDTLYGFSSAYLNLANELNFIYRAKLPEGFENATVTFVIDGFERTVSAFGVDENGNLLFKLPSINPAQMGKAISATLTATKDGVTHTLTYDTLSVKSYLNALNAENNPELATLVDALLTYGAAAQQFDGQSAEDFVTELGELEAIADTVYNVQKSGTGIAQFAMNLRGSFFLRVGIVLPEGTDMTNVKLVATKGENVKEYSLASYTADGTMIAIDYDAITALELGELITFTLMDGENVLSTITLNAYSYLYTANTNKYAEQYPTLAALARAIYCYGEAAKAYATNG